MAKRVASQPLDLTESDDELNEVMDLYESARLADGPLFAIQFNPIGARRRWRNVVIGQQFNAVIRQLRPPAPEDNLGRALIDAFLRAIQTELESLDARGEDRVNFTLQAPGFIHAYQSINFRVEKIVQHSPRLEELLHQLAAKLNSNEALNIQRGYRPRSTWSECLNAVGGEKEQIRATNASTRSISGSGVLYQSVMTTSCVAPALL